MRGKAPRHIALATAALLALALGACDTPPPATPLAGGAGTWHEFEGSWNAAGSRHAIPLGAGRTASIISLRGTMLLAGPGKPGVAFRADVIGLVDSATGLVGRSVWTDERGDEVYGELKGEGTADHNRITGTIVGGTGRYAGATGDFAFSWKYVIEAGEGAIQGRGVALKGRVRGQAVEQRP